MKYRVFNNPILTVVLSTVFLCAVYYYFTCELNVFSSVTTVATCVMAYYAYVQNRTTTKQTNISLYESRYHKLFKPLFDNIEFLKKELSKPKPDVQLILEKTQNSFDELNYGCFLIKEHDFKEIMLLYNEITTKLVGVSDLDIQGRLSKLKEVDNHCNQIFSILKPYLQVGDL